MTGPRGWDSSAAAGQGRIPSFAVTGGRVEHAEYRLTASTLLLTRPARNPSSLMEDSLAHEEREALLLHCTGMARAVAEVAERIGRPVSVVKVLAGDLLLAGALSVADEEEPVNPDLLQRLLTGLKAMPD